MTVRLGILGAVHAHLLEKLRAIASGAAGDIVVVSAFESNPRVRAQRAVDPLFADIRWAPRAEDILADDSIDAIVVDGEVWQFLGDARAALLADKHVYLEKPAGTSLANYRSLLDLAAERRRVVLMAYHLRHSPAFRLLRQLAADGALGDVFNVRGRFGKPRSDYERWRTMMRYPGHIMFEMCGHLIDQTVALLGRPVRVTPFLRSDHRLPGADQNLILVPPDGTPGEAAGIPFVDNSLAVLEWDRSLAVIESAGMESGASRRFEVLGTHGTFLLEPPGGQIARIYLERPVGHLVAGWQTIDTGPWTPYAADLRNLASAVRGDPVADYDPVHDFIVQETLLRASGVALSTPVTP